MATLERAIYSVTYYWHGIDQRSVQAVIWLYDKLHHLELFQWSNVNGLPFNQVIDNKIEDMITDGHLRVVDRWSRKFKISGLEPIQKNNTLKVFKPFEKFSERFRQSVKFYLNNRKKFKQLYGLYEEIPIPTKTFYTYIYDELRS